jgi:hypothetical protein
MTFVVLADFYCDGSRREKVISRSPAPSRLSAAARIQVPLAQERFAPPLDFCRSAGIYHGTPRSIVSAPLRPRLGGLTAVQDLKIVFKQYIIDIYSNQRDVACGAS